MAHRRRRRCISNPPRACLTGCPSRSVLHGLEGTAESHYVRGFFTEAATRGWGVDLLLFRTCDGRLNLAKRTYHSGETSDPAMALRRVIEGSPDAPVALVGVSLGGNVLLRLLGGMSPAESSRICAAVAISTPYDLARSWRHLQQGVGRMYQWNFVRKLRRKALAKVAQHVGLAEPAAISRARTLWQFDDAFTSVTWVPRCGGYYEQCSSIHVRDRSGFRPAPKCPRRSVPSTRCARRVAARAARNPALTTEFLDTGGHVGFVSGSLFRPRYYAERRTAEFIAANCRARSAHH